MVGRALILRCTLSPAALGTQELVGKWEFLGTISLMANALVALLNVLTILRVASQPWPHPLRFRADGTFKIVEVICTIPGAGTFSALRSS